MNFIRKIIWVVCFSFLLISQSCENEVPELFSLDQDVLLGDELVNVIANDSTIIFLSETQYPESYLYVDGVLMEILGLNHPDSISPVKNRDLFQWDVFLINDPDLNAFVTPAGKIYINSGLIKSLETVDEFASMLAHMINHADQRHITKQLLKFFSSKELTNAASGKDESVLTKIANSLFGRNVAFQFSLADEKQADYFTVDALANAAYACNGAHSFYQRLDKKEDQGNQPPYYLAHIKYDTRLSDINNEVAQQGCSTDLKAEGVFSYIEFKNKLP